MTLIRWVPRLLAGVAGLHILFGLLVIPRTIDPDPLAGILEDGVAGAVSGEVGREALFWFVVTGFGWLAFAHVTHHVVRATGRVPAAVGWWSLGMAVPSVVLMPKSGWWLLVGVGLVALRASRQGEPVPAVR
jgi:Family of unknown function (DUF6463)